MVEVLTFSNETFTDDILLVPVKYILLIGLPVLVVIMLVVLVCCVCNCAICFCIGRMPKKQEETPIRKSRAEREGTIYSEINPAGMLENQRTYPKSTRIIINQLHIDTQCQLEQETRKKKFQKSPSIESTYQEMNAPSHKSPRGLDSVPEDMFIDVINGISVV